MKTKIISLVVCLAILAGLFPGYALAEDDGSTEGSGEATTVVAKIGDEEYGSLAQAVNQAANGSTITVQANVDISSTGLEIPSDKSLTLDINGHTIKAANTETGNIRVYGQLTIQDTVTGGAGKIYTATKYTGSNTGYCLVEIKGENALVTMKSGFIDAASLTSNPANEGQFAVGVHDGGDFTMTGGKIEAGWYAVSGNGNNKTQDSRINIQGGTLISTGDYAIYLPQSGTTTIQGGTIYGAAGGICMRRGTLNISDGLITSLGTGDTGDWGDGTGGLGCAALNAQAKYGECNVSITGGTLTAQQAALIVTNDVKYTIAFTISGGSFSQKPNESYLEEGYVCTERDGNYVVTPLGEDNAAAKIGSKYYETLQQALDALQDGNTLTLLQDGTVSKMLTIDESSVTLDLNGKTLTAAEDFTGTMENGNNCHLVHVTGENVTIKNGTLKTTNKNKHVLNVYGATNFVVENVILDHGISGYEGAPAIITGSTATVKGTLTLVTAKNSWYGINLDNKTGNGPQACKLTIADGATLDFKGNSKSYIGIQMDRWDSNKTVAIEFGKDVTIKALDRVNFRVLGLGVDLTWKDVSATGAEDIGLKLDETGWYRLPDAFNTGTPGTSGGSSATPAPTPAPTPVPTPTPAPTARPEATATPVVVQPDTETPVEKGPETLTVTTQVGSATENALATAQVESQAMQEAVAEAVKQAAIDGLAPAVKVEVAVDETAEAVAVTLPVDALADLAGNEGAALTISSDLAQVTLDATALAAVAGQAQGEVRLVVQPAAAEALSQAQVQAAGEFPVISLTLESQDGFITDFNSGVATVTLPHTLAEGQRAEGVVVWYLDAEGNTTPCPTRYDAAAGLVTFETPHFSEYIIGYDAAALPAAPAEPEIEQPELAQESEPAPAVASFPVVPVAVGLVLLVLVLAFVLRRAFLSK